MHYQSQYDDFGIVTSFENLYNAHISCRRGKLWKDSAISYDLRVMECTMYLQYLLISGKYRISEYHCFRINERGKERDIKSTKYKDRIVQKSLNDNIFKPYIIPKLIHENGANQQFKGTDFHLHLFKQHLQEYLRKHDMIPDGYILIGDYKKFFDSFRHDVLDDIYGRYFNDESIMSLISHIHASIPGGVGAPLGNQLSQMDALMIANDIDHAVKEIYKIRGYARYSDDFYLIHHDKEYLKKCLDGINRMAEERGLHLNLSKTRIVPMTVGVNFLGFRFYVTKTGKVVMKIKSKAKSRERHRIKKHRKKVDEGAMTFEDALHAYQSWRAHASRGDTYYMLRDMDLYFYEKFEEYLDERQKKDMTKLRKSKARRSKKHGKITEQPADRSDCQRR